MGRWEEKVYARAQTRGYRVSGAKSTPHSSIRTDKSIITYPQTLRGARFAIVDICLEFHVVHQNKYFIIIYRSTRTI